MRAELNKYFRELLKDPKYILIGQSIKDPYGGASKVTRGLSTKFPNQVIDTPISEASMIGMALGMAVGGKIPIVEIMFFDFMTLCTDQLFNIGKKLDEVHKINFKLIIRTMRGPEEYGPTHSQHLGKLLDAIGIPWLDCTGPETYETALNSSDKIIVIVEEKSKYENSYNNEGKNGPISK
jgi:pyruvate/2-oxoglutarate/acetoin dehydrogenase E1 component